MLNVVQKDIGWIEVIVGSMFSGKTEEMIRRLRRAEIAKQKVAIFKPQIDDRYSPDHIVSHSEQKFRSVPLKSADEIIEKSLDAHLVAIDECQFFGPEIVEVCQELANSGKRVIYLPFSNRK